MSSDFSQAVDFLSEVFGGTSSNNDVSDQIDGTEKEIDWRIWHGALGKEEWRKPMCVAKTEKMSREDIGTNIKASEYIDHEDVLDEKMKMVAELLRNSRFCIVYTGAGISRASGIPDYGSKAENSVMKKYQELKNPYYAPPTYSHHALTSLEKEGLVHYYIQQNHDGLPQKAGFPQEKINEIHGAWFDPSNPVVRMSGSLRPDLCESMRTLSKKTDLCLCIGTSLSGMNADQCVEIPCRQFRDNGSKIIGESCKGTVVMNLQFTRLDKLGSMPIRVWSKCDDAMKLLMKHLGVEVVKIPMMKNPERGDRVICSYDEKTGQKKDNDDVRTELDLSIGKYVKIVHPGAMNEGRIGRVARKDEAGHYLISFGDRTRRMGTWWLECIEEGRVDQLPLVNVEYTEENKDLEMEKEYRIMREKVPGCNFCERIGKRIKLCRGCHSVYYCNLECQKKDWKVHKKECKKLKAKKKN